MKRATLLAACLSQMVWLTGFFAPERYAYDATPLGAIEIPPHIPATIPEMVVAAAIREGIAPERALALAWNESHFTNAIAQEANGSRSCGPLQLNNICDLSIEENVARGIAHFAKLVRQYQQDAEYAYQHGHAHHR